jgi:hypothetical protein
MQMRGWILIRIFSFFLASMQRQLDKIILLFNLFF